MGRAKEYLMRIRKTEHLVQRMTASIEQIRRDITTLGILDYSQDRVQISAQAGARHEELVAKLLDEEARVTALIDQLAGMRDEACRILDRMTVPEESAVLFYRYIQALTWEQTADATHVSLRSVYNIHGRALQNFERLLK